MKQFKKQQAHEILEKVKKETNANKKTMANIEKILILLSNEHGEVNILEGEETWRN